MLRPGLRPPGLAGRADRARLAPLAECEQKYAYGLVERFITALVDAGYLADRALGSLVRFSFWMLGGAGLALAEAPEAGRPRLREEWWYLIRQTISGLRPP